MVIVEKNFELMDVNIAVHEGEAFHPSALVILLARNRWCIGFLDIIFNIQ